MTCYILIDRVQSVRQAMRSFIKQHDRNCQIINIGAGFDTLFWNLTQEGLQPRAFVELDFPQVCQGSNQSWPQQLSQHYKCRLRTDNSLYYQLTAIHLHESPSILSVVFAFC